MTKTQRRFMDGRLIQLTGLRPDADLPMALVVDVLNVAGHEVEINAGSSTALNAFLNETGSTLVRDVMLPNGLEMSIGKFGPINAIGYPFWSTIGLFRLYGHAGPAVTLQALMQCLGDATVSADSTGVTLRAPRSLSRHPSIMQSVSGDYVIDVRSARRRRRSSGGEPVAGGFLLRSDPEYPYPYLVLDAGRLLAYVLPLPGRDINVAVQDAARLVLTVSTETPADTHASKGKLQ